MNVFRHKGSLYCEPCGKDLEGAEGPLLDGGGPADSPQHCAECIEFLENPLTPAGVQYVKEAVKQCETFPYYSVIRSVWAPFYDF